MPDDRPDTEQFKRDVIRLETRVTYLEKEMQEVCELRSLLHKVDVDIERVDTKIKTTWYLLMLIITGMVSIAFSLWQGGVTP